MVEHCYRRRFLFCSGAAAISALPMLTGCASFWGEEQHDFHVKTDKVRELLESADRPKTVAELAVSQGVNLRKLEGYGLVNGLLSTGGEVRPGGQRDEMLKRMRADRVIEPVTILDSDATALVKISTVSPPGSSKGDSVDLVVEVSSECNASSLVGGWLMPSRLREYAILGGSLRQSNDKASAKGTIVTTPKSLASAGESDKKSGRVLGGGRLLESRDLGLRIQERFKHVYTTKAISESINDRFFFFDQSDRRGVAVPTSDGFIEITLHPKYEHDVRHYMSVMLAMGFLESNEDLEKRIAQCGQLLQDPITARNAALQLEGIGEAGIPALTQGLAHQDVEVRFWASYCLAYLDQEEAIPTLVELAMQQEAFRPLCLVGLGVLDQPAAKDALEALLQYPVPEVRYGALVTLRNRDKLNPLARGVLLGEETLYTEIASANSMVAVSLEEYPEIAVFGENPILQIPATVTMPSGVTLESDGIVNARVRRTNSQGVNQMSIVPSDLRSILFAIDELGGTYNDMVQLLDEASTSGWLPYDLALNPRPHAGRKFERESKLDLDESQLSRMSVEPEELLTDDGESKKQWWQMSKYFE